ncbi:MAG TPA: amidohydrolase family protein [Terracidiphilus sp.]|nr:amidohydrolase family protein [Terracidiphilus sp.]
MKLAALSAGAAALELAGAGAASGAAWEQIPVIDAHIHLFDTLRPGGVPWPEKSDTVIYKPALPERYVLESAAFGIVGAIAIEASPLASDNQWLLNVVRNHPVMVGMVGDLVPSSPTFLTDLERLHGDALFLGIRYGNLWNRDLAADLENAGFIDGLTALARAGLVFESANPDPRLIAAIVEVAERVPDLRIVIDHLPHAPVPTEVDARDQYWANLRLLAGSPRVFVKLSEIPVRENGKLMTDPHFYKVSLDALWDIFGEDHVLFGSDWPNSDHVATYAQTFGIVRGYMAGKSAEAREKYFWKNSIAAYKWVRRRADQPSL